jgi:hypothetical protein
MVGPSCRNATNTVAGKGADHMSVQTGMERRRGKRLVGALLSVVAAAAVLGPGSPAEAADGPPAHVGPLLEVDIKADKVVKVKMGLCQGEVSYSEGWMETTAYFVPKAGCKTSAIQFWYMKSDKSLDWSGERISSYRDTAWSNVWFVVPDQVLRVVVTVEDTTGAKGRVWANTPKL